VQVASAFEHECGEGVPEHMRGNVEPDGRFEPAEHLSDGISSHRRVVPGAHEERRARGPVARPRAEILVQDRGEPGGHRHDAVLFSFPLDDPDHHASRSRESAARLFRIVAEIDVGHPQISDFRPAQASEEHQGNERRVARGFETEGVPSSAGGLYEPFRLFGGESLGQPLRELRPLDLFRRVGIDEALGLQVAEKKSEVLVALAERGRAPLLPDSAVEEPLLQPENGAFAERAHSGFGDERRVGGPDAFDVPRGEVSDVQGVDKALLKRFAEILHVKKG
jgi:hypothetical protein